MNKKKVLIVTIGIFVLFLWILPTRLLFVDIFLGYADSRIHRMLKGNNTKLTANNLQECNQIGGEWKALGGISKEHCQFYSKDANKTCISGFQCEFGRCETSFESGLITSGKCSSQWIQYDYARDVYFGFAEVWGMEFD